MLIIFFSVSFYDHKATIIMNSTGTAYFALDNSIIMTTNDHLYAKKGTAVLTAIDKHVVSYTFDRN